MKYLHFVDEDAQMAPSTGLFVVRNDDGKIVELSLVIAYNTAQREDFLLDYGNQIIHGARVRKWWRWTLQISRKPLPRADRGSFIDSEFVPFDSDPSEEEQPPRFQWDYAKDREPIIEPDSKITRKEPKTIKGRLGVVLYPPTKE